MRIFFYSFFLIFSTLSNTQVLAKPEIITQKDIQYQSFAGTCPAKSSALMFLAVMKEFEKNNSLKDVKERILNEKLDEKYFLSSYRVKFNPIRKLVKIYLECPIPLAKIHVYKSNGEEHYTAILGNNKKLYEPQFEILLKAEKKLNYDLPLIALKSDQVQSENINLLTDFIRQVKINTRQKISEIILNKNKELTVVFSLGGASATSVFFGTEFWDVKISKLEKFLSYVSKNKRFPTSINLVNAKKVIVKFSDNL